MSEGNAEGLTIDYLGGNCPVQAEGTLDGLPFYFRARGEHWSFRVGGADVVSAPEWEYEEFYGEWPAAGWMTEAEAVAAINKAESLWRARLTPPPAAPDPADQPASSPRASTGGSDPARPKE